MTQPRYPPSMDAATIAAELEGRKEGNQYRCRCPVHGGRSLMVKDAEDRVLVHCWGGCEAHTVLSELRSRNLLPSPSEDQRAAYRQQKFQEEVNQARMLVIIAHESHDCEDRFGQEYRWARKILRRAGYIVRFVPPNQREWPDQRVEVVARESPKNGGLSG